MSRYQRDINRMSAPAHHTIISLLTLTNLSLVLSLTLECLNKPGVNFLAR